jgi:hypothetical protein
MRTVKEIKKGLPNGMIKVGEECERAIVRLVKQGRTQDEATNIVLKLLEDSKPYLEQGLFSTTIESIRMITT